MTITAESWLSVTSLCNFCTLYVHSDKCVHSNVCVLQCLYRTLLYHTLLHRIVLYNYIFVPYTIQNIKYNTIHNNTIQYCAVQYCTEVLQVVVQIILLYIT